jgi:phosphohistidine phosphatase
MKLYLVQHAKAVEKEVDAERPLSGEGRKDIEKVAAFLKESGLSVERVWDSGKLRAVQTAEALAGAINAKEVRERQGLKPNDSVEAVADELKAGEASIMLVGHMPFVSRLAAVLVTGSREAEVVRFRQGGLVCLGRDEEGKWAVEWMVIPGILV